MSVLFAYDLIAALALPFPTVTSTYIAKPSINI